MLTVRISAYKNILIKARTLFLFNKKNYYFNFLKIAWPAAVEAVLVGLVGSINTIMVGGLGAGAIAAVGITNQPRFILLAIMFSLDIGITAIISRRKGENDRYAANRFFRQALVISIFIAVVMSVVGFLFSREILSFAGATSDYIDDATTYFNILMISIFLSSVNLAVNAAQRGSGNTYISMKTNIISNIINLIFNYLLINGAFGFPRLGIAGSAVATAIGYFVACCISFYTLLKRDSFLSLRFKAPWRFEKTTLKNLANVSGSAMVEQVFSRIGFLIYAIIVAKLGTIAYATHQICMNIINLSFCFGDGIGIAAATLVGQSLGAKKPQRAVLYGKIGQRIAFLISTVLFFLFIFGKVYLVSLFSSDIEIIKLGSIVIVTIALCTHAQTSQIIINGCLRGAGDTRYVAFTSLISIAIVRPILTFVLCIPLKYGLIGAWVALAIDQYMRLIIAYIRFKNSKWLILKL